MLRAPLASLFVVVGLGGGCVGEEPAERSCAFIVTCQEGEETSQLIDAECEVLGVADDGSFEYECTCLTNDGANRSPASQYNSICDDVDGMQETFPPEGILSQMSQVFQSMCGVQVRPASCDLEFTSTGLDE